MTVLDSFKLNNKVALVTGAVDRAWPRDRYRAGRSRRQRSLSRQHSFT